MGAVVPLFIGIFLAEFGDKTQIIALLTAADGKMVWWKIWIICSLALCLSSGVAILIGALTCNWLQTVPVKLISGLAFIGIGLWTLYTYFKA